MKTYIWGCNNTNRAFDYEFLVVMAESLYEARNLAIKQLEHAYKQSEGYYRYGKDSEESKSVNNDHPIIIEPNVALIIEHANE